MTDKLQATIDWQAYRAWFCHYNGYRNWTFDTDAIWYVDPRQSNNEWVRIFRDGLTVQMPERFLVGTVREIKREE